MHTTATPAAMRTAPMTDAKPSAITPGVPSPDAVANATAERAKQFAEAMTTIIRQVLSCLDERQGTVYLDALHDSVSFEIWSETMALASMPGAAEDEDDHGASF